MMANSVGKGFPTTNLQVGHVFCDVDDATLWQFLGGIPTSVASWILIGGCVNEQPDTSQWGLAQAGAVWFHTAYREYYGWNGSTITPLAIGQGINAYNFRRRVVYQDDFIGGSQTAGFIGAIGFNGTGTLTVRSGEAERPGIFRIDTGAVSGTAARLILLQTSFAFSAIEDHSLLWVARPNNIDGNTSLRFGCGNSGVGNPPGDGFYFEKLDGDTTWFTVTRASSVETRVNTNIPITISFADFLYRRTATKVEFYINGTLVNTHTTTLTTVPVTPLAFVINSAAAAKTADIDYFEFVSSVTR